VPLGALVAVALEWTDLAAGVGRRRSRRINVGKVAVGDGAPVSVQSMTITKTADINGTLQQIAELAATGCDIVRVAVPDTDDAAALPAIAAKSTIPVVADIHFQWTYAMAAIEAGCAGVRINPGNIKKHDKVKLIAQEAQARGIPIRVGVNAGSLRKELLAKHGGPPPEALVESALFEVGILEEVGFGDIKISVKHQNPVSMIAAYRLLATRVDYPLHLGVTEAGTPRDGIVKSSVGIGALLAQGIGDTIRVSLTAPPIEEGKAGHAILGAPSPPRRSRRSRRATPSSVPSACGPRSSTWSPARPAGGPRSTCSPWPTPSRSAWARSSPRCGSRSWAASSTAPGRPARPTWVWPRARARARSSATARSSGPSPRPRSSMP